MKSENILTRLTSLCSWKKNVETENAILHFGHKHNGNYTSEKC